MNESSDPLRTPRLCLCIAVYWLCLILPWTMILVDGELNDDPYDSFIPKEIFGTSLIVAVVGPLLAGLTLPLHWAYRTLAVLSILPLHFGLMICTGMLGIMQSGLAGTQ